MDTNRKYRFTWELLGDLELGRPNLGPLMPLSVYRLMLFCFRDVLEESTSSRQTDEIFFKAGKLAGEQFYKHVLVPRLQSGQFWPELQAVLKELKMGILRVEEADANGQHLTLTISEDLDCSGLPELDNEVCVYDEGFLSGLLEAYNGWPYDVREIDCWATGDRTCRFQAKARRG